MRGSGLLLRMSGVSELGQRRYRIGIENPGVARAIHQLESLSNELNIDESAPCPFDIPGTIGLVLLMHQPAHVANIIDRVLMIALGGERRADNRCDFLTQGPISRDCPGAGERQMLPCPGGLAMI